jgi:crossover junction endodeoxyribonuclease RuvC
MTAPTVVGLDLSLTSTGFAILTDTGAELSTRRSTAATTLRGRYHRLARLTTLIVDDCDRAALVVVEGPSHGQGRQAGQHDRAGLWWLVVRQLHALGYDVAEVPPACRARYATGKGNAGKAAVVAAVARRYPWADLTGTGAEDKADALLLAAMGRRRLGYPIDDPLPKTHLAGMDGVAWPDPATP